MNVEETLLFSLKWLFPLLGLKTEELALLFFALLQELIGFLKRVYLRDIPNRRGKDRQVILHL